MLPSGRLLLLRTYSSLNRQGSICQVRVRLRPQLVNSGLSQPAMDPFPQIHVSSQRKVEAVTQFQQPSWGEMLAISLESF